MRWQRIALQMLWISFLGTSMSSFAQESTEISSDANIGKLIVTGSHIRKETEDKSPIDVITREDLTSQGINKVIDAIKYLPANTGSFLTQEVGSLTGTSQFNIRGLGAGSTLTLINGKRGGKSPVADGNGNQFFDLNQLPPSMIGRLDIQKDGASSTYGSDAVGGVVNIITRKGFEGFELNAQIESATNQAFSLGVASGKAFSMGSFNLYAGYYEQDRNIRTDFDFIERRINGNGNPLDSVLTSGTGGPGTYQLAILDEQGNYLGSSGNKIYDPNCEAAGGIVKNDLCRHSFADQLSILPEEQRFQLFTEFDFDVTNSLTLYSEISYSKNFVNATIVPQLFRNGLADGNILIPADHPFNFFVSDGTGGITYIDPSDWDNSVHTAVPLNCSCRPLGIEFNGYQSEFDREIEFDYQRALLGAEYLLGNGWFLDISFLYNSGKRKESEGYNYRKAELNAAINTGLFNPFGSRTATPGLLSPKDLTSYAGLSQDVLMSFMHFRKSSSQAKQFVVDLISGGDLFEVENGYVSFAAGIQYRKDELKFKEDPLWAAGQSRVPELSDEVISGDETVHALFSEILWPIFENVEVSAAFRYENYGGGIGSTTDPKIAIRWNMNGRWSLRGSYGSSFQAPSVSQSSSSSGQAFINDPASMNANGAIVCENTGLTSNTTILVQGAENLKPQHANSLNSGLVFKRGGLNASLDYWQFEYSDLIRPDGSAQSIVDNDCNDGQPDDPRVVRSSSGQIRSVQLSFINTGEVLTDGVDLNISYHGSQRNLFDYSLKFNASYVNRFDITSESGDGHLQIIQGAGKRNFSNPFASVPRWRANIMAEMIQNQQVFSGAIRYISNYDNDQAGGEHEIDSWLSTDIRYSYNLDTWIGAKSRLNLGVNNVFNRQPPSLGYSQRPGYDANVHDIRGRIVLQKAL